MEKPGTPLRAPTRLAEKGCDFIHRPLTPPAAETPLAGELATSSHPPLFFRGPGAPHLPLAHPHLRQPEGERPPRSQEAPRPGGSHTPLRGTRKPSSHGLPLVRPPVGEETGTRVSLEVTQDTPGLRLTPFIHSPSQTSRPSHSVLDFKT